MKAITIEVPDEVYEIFHREAMRKGCTVEQCVMEFFLKHGPHPQAALSEKERRAALEKVERYIGAACSGDARSADNERIDSDLAQEYSSTHEEAP